MKKEDKEVRVQEIRQLLIGEAVFGEDRQKLLDELHKLEVDLAKN